MKAYILIIWLTQALNHPTASQYGAIHAIEFNNKASCQRAAGDVKAIGKNIYAECFPK